MIDEAMIWARAAMERGDCIGVDFTVTNLIEDDFDGEAAVNKWSLEYGVHLSKEQRLEISQLAKDALREAWSWINLHCDVDHNFIEVSAGGGASRLNLPQMPIGTGPDERVVTKTVDEVDGSSFNIEVTAPVGRGYSGYFRYQFSEGDGSSRGGVEQGTFSAITFPAPIDGETGLFSNTAGLNIATHTDFEMNDFSFGFGGPVNFFGPSVQTNIFGGARVINIDRTDRIFQQFDLFPDIFMNTNVEQDSWLYGPQAGISIENRPFQGSGFTYGAGGSISFLVGSVTHLTDAPYVHIPVNPTDPLRIDEDDLTSWDILFSTTLRFGGS